MIIVHVYVIKTGKDSHDSSESHEKSFAKIVQRKKSDSNRKNIIRVMPGETWTTKLCYPSTLTIHDTIIYEHDYD